MSVPSAQGLVPATYHGSLKPRTVLVAEFMRRGDGSVVACPAASLVSGELRRHGIRPVLGTLHIQPNAQPSPGIAVLAVMLGDNIAIGVACDDHDRPGRLAAQLALAAWLSAAAPRSILLTSPRSFCAGVERAIEVVERALAYRDPPIYVRRQIVHNAHVVADLEARGAVFVHELDAVPDGSTVVFSAHGVSPAVRAEAERRRLEVIDATCPLVTKVHAEARRFAARGDTVILVGHAPHDEVEGTMGELAPGQMILVQDTAQVADLRIDDPSRVSYLTQTTLAVEETAAVTEALRARFPLLRGPASDDICYASTNRQEAVKAICGSCDLVLVVGSANSSNSRRLVEVAHRHKTPAYLVEDAGDIRPEWLASARVVGLTAGASAPPHLVDEIVAALSGLGQVTVTEHEVTRETIQFTLPGILRSSR